MEHISRVKFFTGLLAGALATILFVYVSIISL